MNELSIILFLLLSIMMTLVESKINETATTTTTRHSAWWKEVIAGAIAGQIEIVFTYPLDVLKTRAMFLGGHENRSMLSALNDIVSKHGFVSGLFGGISAPMICALPWRATKFMSFSQFKRILHRYERTALPDGTFVETLAKLTTTQMLSLNIIAGIGVGITESMILNPFEVVKVCMIADSSRPSSDKLYKNSLDCAQQIYKQEGFRGFYKGYWATCYRQILFSSTYFTTYLYCKEFVIPSVLATILVTTNVSILSFDHLNHLVSGLFAGVAGSVVNTPMDVVKTKLQQDLTSPSIIAPKAKIHSPLQGLFILYQSQGMRGLYAGLIPKLMRAGPGAAISFCIYEYLLRVMK